MSVHYYLLTLLLISAAEMTRCDVIAVFVNMGLSNEDKVLIKSLFELKGYNAHQFMKEFPNKDWNKSSLNWLLKKLRDTGTVNRQLCAPTTTCSCYSKDMSILHSKHY